MTTQAAPSSKVVTGKVRLSYVSLFETNDKGKYSTAILIPKSDTATLNKIKAACEAVKADPKSAQKWGGKWLASFKYPLRDGDTDRDVEKNPEYKGCYFVNCNSGQKPGVVDAALDPIMDKEQVYSGCYGRVSINFYPFNTDGNKGIAAGLNNVQKMADGDPLSGRSRAEDDFTAVEDDFLS
jgi:hypothetical protein